MALGSGLPRLEWLEDRILLASTDVNSLSATTLPATAVTNTAATLNGSVNPNDTSTDTLFQYSTDPTLAPHVVTTFAGTAGQGGSADGTGAAARFNQPSGEAVDAAGNVYVADSGNSTIRKITPGGVVTTLAGSAGLTGSADGTGAAARFHQPEGVAVDAAGNVYVVDSVNETIRKITPGGIVTTIAGTAGQTGTADGTGAAARFEDPAGVAVDAAGNVYVADSLNDTIRKITPAGVVTTLAGTALQSGSADGTGAAARFFDPLGVAVDGAGNVFVTDAGNGTIREITPGGIVTTIAGTAGQGGSADGTGAAARFDSPDGVAVDAAGNVYVADTDNETIREITPGGVVTTLAGTAHLAGSADGTGAAAHFTLPASVAVDAAGNVYVADPENATIRKVSNLTVLAQSGVDGTTSVPVSAPLPGLQPGTTYYFRAVATNPDGSALGSILSFTTPTTNVTSLSATTLPATAITNTAATLNGSVNPNDTSTDTLFQYSTDPTLAPHVVTTFAGTVSHFGSADGTGAAAQFNQPVGIAVDGAGNVYAADSLNFTIRKITPAGVVTTLAGSAGQQGFADGTGAVARFAEPEGVAVDAAGNVYVADTANQTIRKITPAGVVTTLAGSAGQVGSADGTGAAARFAGPEGVAVDAAGNVYVADTANSTIRMITPSGVVTTLAGTAGTAGSADGTAAAAQFNEPKGLAVDGAGNVYVADSRNDTIRIITPGGLVTTLAGSAGQHGGTDGTGATARFNQPFDVAVDAAGNVYVADTGNDTIRMITPGGVVTTLAGTAGQGGSADGTGAAAGFDEPEGVAVDGVGNLYVGDTANSTIRKVSNPTVVAQSGVDGTTSVPVSAPLPGLQPGTTYYFRAAATNPNGSALGSILNFTTPTTTATPPVATTQSATALTTSTATLGGSVNPEGSATTVTFVYGTDPTLASGTTTAAQAIGGGTNSVAVIAALTGLQPGTTYYDRVVATSAGGTTNGAILSFATTSPSLVATSTRLSASLNPATLGQLVTFTAVVAPSAGTGTPTGGVTFTIDGRAEPSQQLAVVNGQNQATFSTATLAAGAHTVTAAYSGDPTFAASPSNTVFQLVQAPASQGTVVSLTAAPNPSTAGQAVTLTAIITPSPSALIVTAQEVTPASGTVTFILDGTSQTPVPVQVVNGTSMATLTLSGLAAGTHLVQAAYSGDATFAPSISPVVTLVVNPAPVVDGPQVTNVLRYGYHLAPTTLVLNFNKPLDPARAENPANYRIVGPTGLLIPVTSAVYDPTTLTVTLHPNQRIDPHRHYVLTVNGQAPNGLTDTSGNLLDGNGRGKPGVNYLTVVSFSNLVLGATTPKHGQLVPANWGRREAAYWVPSANLVTAHLVKASKIPVRATIHRTPSVKPTHHR